MRTPELLELTTNDALQARLERVVQGRRYRQVKVGLLCEGRMATATLVDSAEVIRNADASMWMPTGCMTKLFTSALVLQFVRRGHLRLDEDAGERLKESCPAVASRLAGITVTHLLEHAHGLDDSGLRETSLLDDGRIDVGLLAEKMTSTPPLCAPGTLYSYDHIGAILLAAILEHVSGRTWYSLLQEELFAPLGMEHRLLSAQGAASGYLRVCPSRGYDLAVRVEGMLAFIEKHARETFQEDASMTKLPGWHSTETGTRFGWKCYEGGWIGHNSEPPAAAAVVRVHPRERIAIVVETGADSPAPLVVAMFGRLLPELVRIRFPPLLNASACAGLDAGRYVGQFENEVLRIVITRSTDAVLELRAHRRRNNDVEHSPFVVTPLRPAQDGIFYLLPDSAHLAPFVQFIGDTGREFRFLWNGQSVWRNVIPS